MSTVVPTSDGSHTLRSDLFGELYHSHHGAITESLHVFIEHGLDRFREGNGIISVLEYGFGTGLNAVLSWIWSDQHQRAVHYRALESNPISVQSVAELNYPTHLGFPDFVKLHEIPWENPGRLSNTFTLHKINEAFEQYRTTELVDVVFYDAFAPDCQPHLWLTPHLQKVADVLKPGGLLVSYCAKGSFKRALRDLGFDVKSPPGPPGKRQMTCATLAS